MTNKPIKQDDEWGNIELPGLSDEELLTKNWNMVRDSDNLTKQKHWKNNHKKGIEQRGESWHSNVIEANKRKYNDEQYLEQHRQRMAKRTNSKEWQDKIMENAKKRKKSIMTPDGIFDSRIDAAKHFGHAPSWILTQCKLYPSKWYYIENGKTNG